MENADKLDQFYTKPEIAKFCIEFLKKNIPEASRAQFLEPSAGNGSFSKNLENCLSFDIDPKSSEIIKADFLKLKKE